MKNQRPSCASLICVYTGVSRKSAPASFIRPSRQVDHRCGFVHAVKKKYGIDLDQSAYGVKFDRGNDTIRISGKEVEEIGFDRIRRQLANLRQLRILVVDTLRINRPHARSLNAGNISHDVADTCPNVWELDISRNLFETWSEIVDVCRQLPRLTSVRIDGNRLADLDPRAGAHILLNAPFNRIKILSLNDTLLDWDDVAYIARNLPALSSLAANGNEYQCLSDASLPLNIETLHLERNNLRSLEAIMPARRLQNLRSLHLKENPIDRTTNNGVVLGPGNGITFPSTLQEINMPFCSVRDWSFIDELDRMFPALISLRVAHNPLFDSLVSADGKSLTLDDGYMLTLARLGKLTRLNFSVITPKERRNAELYYLSQVNYELSLASNAQIPKIVARHPRYRELCLLYNQPDQQTQKPALTQVDPRSLAASLVKVTFNVVEHAVRPDSETASTVQASAGWSCELPKSFSIYKVVGVVAKRLGRSPRSLQLQLGCPSNDVPYEQAESDTSSDDDNDDDDIDDDNKDDRNPNGRAQWALQIQEPIQILTPLVRSLGTFVQNNRATIWVHQSTIAVAL